MQDNIQIYVDPRGHNDSNNAGSQSNPVQTADKAFTRKTWCGLLARASLAAPDV